MLSWSQTGLRLVANMQRAGIWPITSSELTRASRSATSLGPVCGHARVMDQTSCEPVCVCNQVRAARTWLQTGS